MRRPTAVRLAAALVAMALAALLAVPSADAQRRPTRGERAEIANAVGVPKRCLVTRVSTVNERWAVAWLKRCRLDGSKAVFHYKRGLWRDSYMAPRRADTPCRRIDYVRARVARDLGICGRRDAGGRR